MHRVSAEQMKAFGSQHDYEAKTTIQSKGVSTPFLVIAVNDRVPLQETNKKSLQKVLLKMILPFQWRVYLGMGNPDSDHLTC